MPVAIVVIDKTDSLEYKEVFEFQFLIFAMCPPPLLPFERIKVVGTCPPPLYYASCRESLVN